MSEVFTTTGLLMAATTSVTNVFKDIAGKKVVDQHELVASTFWIRFFAAIVFAGALLVRIALYGAPVVRPDLSPLFGVPGWFIAPLPTYFIYLLIEVSLIVCSTLLFFRAMQVSPISLCMPYVSFTPVFLLVTGRIINHETISQAAMVGVLLIFIGSMVMHRALWANGWLEPIKAIYRERGCLYMLIAGFIMAITNPIDKKLVTMTDAFTQGCGFGVGMALFFGVLALVRRADVGHVIRTTPSWCIIAGTGEAIALLFQLMSHNYIQVVITISIKRAGIILTVLLGWLIFKEKDVGDKLIAASVMLAGVLIIYLKLDVMASLGLAGAALLVMAIAMYLTRKPAERADELKTEITTAEG
jgi:drug/metabolite transporter (DMT)-like permease